MSTSFGPRLRRGRPVTIPPDIMWALEQLAGCDGYLDARTWLLARLREMVRARADELPKEAQ